MKKLVLSLAGAFDRLLPDSVKQALYRHPRLARPIRGLLNRAAPGGLAVVEVAAGGLTGLKLELDLQAEKTYWLGTYEPELQAAIADLVQPGWVAYDVGANIGYITLLLARAVGQDGRVTAFEPLPENVRRMQRNLALNDLQGRVECLWAAVIDQTREVEFLTGPSHKMGKVQGSAGQEKVEYGATLRVPGYSLDEYTRRGGVQPPDLVKMDIEGGEILALPGMLELLSAHRTVVFLELHGPRAARVAWDILTRTDYQICRMEPGYPAVTSLEQLDWKEYLVARPKMRAGG
jgi:FkbM family methyltransferase